MATEFRWIVEASGPKYLAVRHLSMMHDFIWTGDHDQALAFRSEEQADGMLSALRQMDRDLNSGALFAFENTLGPAKAVEHGWMEK